MVPPKPTDAKETEVDSPTQEEASVTSENEVQAETGSEDTTERSELDSGAKTESAELANNAGKDTLNTGTAEVAEDTAEAVDSDEQPGPENSRCHYVCRFGGAQSLILRWLMTTRVVACPTPSIHTKRQFRCQS